ncbi:Na/Pi cotransporter family protein (plasmid) [Pseudorhodobacter turbinis]|uniref:Na/Pi cotransporter family protein n=1 Tax=Pseudorhodobacter turbinis TaxID=2500533 RepID=A0A4P8EKA3_9RHOB|nr:Na/Pi cotransporter family protein [Pseudorhodobacter turbinis]QCO57477.1 Na/Pi cotransporter family protein [Pseudorhodobacter turbinis]
MLPVAFLIHLAGAVLLLLWAVRMVRTGVERAHGTRLKSALRGAKGGTPQMALVGMILAVVLQSSTAVGILAAGFVTSGILTVSTGIAALLGADLGSALVVKILSFDLSGLIPFLLLVGATMFLKFEARTVRQTGRIVLGIAFILLSLQMVGDATEPLRDSALMPGMMAYLQGDPLTAFLAAAVIAWVVHSSVATVLLFVTFASSGLLPLEVAVPMVLGANLGGGIIAVWLTRGMEVEARRIPLGNLIFRGVAAAALLTVSQIIAIPIALLGGSEPVQLVNFHLAFNLGLLLLALPLVRPMARLTAALLPDPTTESATDDVAQAASMLDHASVDNPRVALASAKRELLRMGETVATMYHPIMELMDGGSLDKIKRVRALDEQVNRKHTDIKLFVAQVQRGNLTEAEAKLGNDLTDFSINLEYIGDIIAKSLLGLAETRAKKGLRFSPEGWTEMCNLHSRVEANLQLALNVLVSGDVESARQLVKEKEMMRKLERESHDRHLERLRNAHSDSIDTSDIHLETVRAFKEINSLLVTVAYPILTESGHLLESRLAQPK